MSNPDPGRPGPELMRRTRGRPMVLSGDALVDARPYADHARSASPAAPDGHVLLVQPAIPGVDLAVWAAGHRAWLETQLHAYGGLLFRGFGVASSMILDQVIAAIAGEPLSYRERSSPRTQVSGNVYTSTEHPPDQRIFLHCENSYQHVWPRRVFFCCVTPAETGGQTPIADTRRVFAQIDPAIRRRFADRQVMYVRNFGDGLGLSWQAVFQTDDPAVVEDYCRAAGITWTWRDGQRLTTRQIRPAIARHPDTGQDVWFNHATFFHVTTLDPLIREVLLSRMREDELPNNTYYGDGQPIEPAVMDEMRAAYAASTRLFEWERGDLLLLDNMLMAHGREPFTGTRRVLVGMAAPMAWSDLA
jgi:alpha-ketoglutarate-dependent taurine dioxygenase